LTQAPENLLDVEDYLVDEKPVDKSDEVIQDSRSLFNCLALLLYSDEERHSDVRLETIDFMLANSHLFFDQDILTHQTYSGSDNDKLEPIL